MALRARLTPPREERKDWPWHKVQSGSLPASLLSSADRRMEAESYLTDGFAIRAAIQRHETGRRPLGTISEVRQPSRLKGTNMPLGMGAAYLSATQVFDLRPTARRWLSVDRIKNIDELTVTDGQILVTRSGTVGRATLAYSVHRNKVISDDLLRVTPHSESDWGWLYAFLRSPLVQKAMTSLHYGHVIKHLEVSHLQQFPAMEVGEQIKAEFSRLAHQILKLRNKSVELRSQAEKLISEATGVSPAEESDALFIAGRASEFFGGRRRLEATFHSPQVRYILKKFADGKLAVSTVQDLVHGTWWMTRFSRHFGSEGVVYKSSDDLFSLSPFKAKRIHIHS